MHFKLKVGKRIIKTAITLFLIFLIYIALLFLDEILQINPDENWKAPSNMYTPFFAGIAAIYATHRNKKASIKQAKVRSIGTIIGGYFGMILVFLLEFIFIDIFHIDQNHFAVFALIKYFIVTIFIIPLIIVSIKLKQTDSVFITCLTYLSVTVSMRNGGMPVFQFATNRVLSTLIGVGVSLLVNVSLFTIKKKNKNILFVSTLENNILSNNDELSPYVKYKLNDLYESEINMIFATTRTAIAFQSIFNDINITSPMIVMNGAAKYDFVNKTYEDVYHISNDERKIIEEHLKEANINAFTFTINDNVMHAYYNNVINPGEKLYFAHRKKQSIYSFVKGILPDDLSVTLYLAIDTKENIDNFIDKIKKTGKVENINFIVYKYKNNIEGIDYYYLRIVNNKTNKENAIRKLQKKYNTKYLVACISGNTDMPLIEKAQLSMCLSTAPDYIKEKVDYIVNGGPDEALKIFDKIYHSRNVEKTIETFKK